MSGAFTTMSRELAALLAPIAASASAALVAEKAALFQSARTRPGFSRPAAMAVAISPADAADLSRSLRVVFIISSSP